MRHVSVRKTTFQIHYIALYEVERAGRHNCDLEFDYGRGILVFQTLKNTSGELMLLRFLLFHLRSNHRTPLSVHRSGRKTLLFPSLATICCCFVCAANAMPSKSRKCALGRLLPELFLTTRACAANFKLCKRPAPA